MKIIAMRQADFANVGVVITTLDGSVIGTSRGVNSVFWLEMQDYFAGGGKVDPVIVTAEEPVVS